MLSNFGTYANLIGENRCFSLIYMRKRKFFFKRMGYVKTRNRMEKIKELLLERRCFFLWKDLANSLPRGEFMIPVLKLSEKSESRPFLLIIWKKEEEWV